jgi:hypothetical protein
MARPGYKLITLKGPTFQKLEAIRETLNSRLPEYKRKITIPQTVLYLCEQFVKYEGLNTGIQKLETHAEVETKIAESFSASKGGSA